jgi:coenzyme PQQ synthesis protein D (PqqD)
MPDRGPERTDGIEVNAVADGYVVYDTARDRVHYLNHTAALVLELCTGENSTDEIVRLLQVAFELPEPPTREANDCLEQLRGEGLIT